MQLRSELDLTRKECQSTNREILIKISRELELKDPNLDLGPSIDGLQVSKGDLTRMEPENRKRWMKGQMREMTKNWQ
jgi:hypothetical protein